MFWDKAAAFYYIFENLYNHRVNTAFCSYVADQIMPEDHVLECACGTGMISAAVAPRCAHLTATDFSQGMLKQTKSKCAEFSNMTIESADIMQLKYADDSFDKVIAGNVIHLLDDPAAALKEMSRVCKKDGCLIIPTYINKNKNGKTNGAAKLLQKGGAGFKREFDAESYIEFFREAGYMEASLFVAEGHMPCAVAVLHNVK